VRITQVAVKVFGDTVQLAIAGTGALTYRTLQLSSPPRLVIDLPGAVLDQAVPPILDVDRGAVVRVRIGQFQERPPVTRVAVDLTAAVSFTLATSSPGVLVAKFASRGGVASTTAPGALRSAAPAAPAPMAQAPPPPPPVVPAPAPAAPPAVPGAPAAAPGRITLEFRNTELADVLTALSRVCNTNIVTDASVKGQVTVRLVDLTCEESLRFILEANNLGFRRIGRNLIIMAAEKLAPPPEAPEAITYPVGFGKAEDVAKAIGAAIKGILVTFDARSNAMIVVGTVAQHEEVRKVLAGLDILLPQVMIEARVVDISTNALREVGLRWGLTSESPAPIIRIEGTFPNQIVLGIGDFAINAQLTALIDQGKGRVLSAPRVAVLDGHSAVVNLGEEIPIPATDSAGRVTYTFKPVGVILSITPKVNRDGLMTVKVEPEVSSVRELLIGGIPRIATRKASTTVTVRSGESVVIGGLISTEERTKIIKVPLLGDIPLIGSLFRYTSVDRRESEVIFVVTPHIIPPQGAPAPAVTPRP
jgi:type IV pilus assembly protein PilQ